MKKIFFWQLQALLFVFLGLAAAFFLSLKIFYWLCLISLTAGAHRAIIAPIFWLAGIILWFFLARKIFCRAAAFATLSGTAYKASTLLPELVHHLPPAADFLIDRRSGSAELAEEHIAETAKMAKDAPVFLFARAWPGAVCLMLGLLAAIFAIIPGSGIFPFRDFLNPLERPVLEDYFSIVPGDLEMIEKQDISISACTTKPFGGDMFIEEEAARKKMERSGNCFRHTKEKVSESFDYRLFGGGLKSRKYRVRVIEEPGFGRVKTEVFPPYNLVIDHKSYDFIPENLAISEGTSVSFSFLSPRSVDGLYADIKGTKGTGSSVRPVRLLENGGYLFRQTLSRDSEISFYIRSRNGYSALFSRSAIKILEDAPPKCEILNYSTGEKVLPGASLKLDYAARDDLGIREVYLVKEHYSGESPAEKKERKLSGSATFPRELSGSSLIAFNGYGEGSHLEISIRAVDVKGQTCISKKLKLFPDGAIARHDENLERMAEYLSDLHKLGRELAIPVLAMEKIKNLFSSLGRKGPLIKNGVSSDDFFEKWSKDNISSAISRIENTETELLPRFLSGMNVRERISAAVNASASELRFSLEMEGAAALGVFAGNMENSLKRMEELLSGEEVWSNLSELSAELKGLMDELEKIKKSIPPVGLAGEEGDKTRIFNLPAGEIAGNVEALKSAMENRDIKTAREYLKRLSESVRKLSSILTEYKEYSYKNSAMEARLQEANRFKEKWQQIYADEKKEFSRNSVYGDLFFPLFDRRRLAAADRISRELSEVKKSSPPADVLAELDKAIPAFSDGKYISLSSATMSVLPANTCALISAFNENISFVLPEERDHFMTAVASQNLITRRTLSLKEEVEIYFFLNGPMEKLKKAAHEMQEAEGKFAAFDLESAISCQLRALNYLEQGEKEFEENAKEMLKSFRSGASSSRWPGSGVAQEGSQTMRLPGPEDYSPPELIRKEVMKSMGEKAPQADRELLLRYYRSITR